MTETNRIEYKRQLNESLEKEVVAFLNYREGGLVYIGVEDTGEGPYYRSPFDREPGWAEISVTLQIKTLLERAEFGD